MNPLVWSWVCKLRSKHDVNSLLFIVTHLADNTHTTRLYLALQPRKTSMFDSVCCVDWLWCIHILNVWIRLYCRVCVKQKETRYRLSSVHTWTFYTTGVIAHTQRGYVQRSWFSCVALELTTSYYKITLTLCLHSTLHLN